ncbi:MAG: hypothetical protein M3132_11510 [Actinomycetia bacterium]|nr:hypothetical protein [Actinomycetes bacterium]
MLVKTSRPMGLLYTLDLPLRHPFATATGTLRSRQVAIVSLNADGLTGWGEAAPYPGQDESFDVMVAGFQSGTLTPTCRAAIDEALWDLRARLEGTRLRDSLPSKRSTLPMSIAIGMDNDALRRVAGFVDDGITRFKVKIAPGHTAHVREIREAFPDITLGLDANGAFSPRTLQELGALVDQNIAYLEQPVSDLTEPSVIGLKESGFIVLADESVRSSADAASVLGLPGVDGVVIKPGRLGWRGSLTAVEHARSSGKLWRVSSLLETGIGRAYSESLASADDVFLPDISSADEFFTHDVVPSRASGPTIVIAKGHGVGIEVDVDALRSEATQVLVINESAVPDLG